MDIFDCKVLDSSNSWLSACFRASVLRTVIPASVILLTVLYDLLKAFHFPKFLRVAAGQLVSPFRNFLHLEDLEEADPLKLRIEPPRWKIIVLALLPSMEFFGYISSFAYYGSIYSHNNASSALISAVTWLYAFARICIKPPSTPPYLLLIFYGTHVLSACIDLMSDVRGAYATVVLDVVRLVVPSLLMFVIGTLPVNDVLPGPSIASSKDTPSSSFSCPEDAVTLWEWCTFSFVENIFRLAMSRRLEGTDIWTLSPFFKHKNLFRKYLEYCNRHPTHSLLRFLLASNSLDLILDLALELWNAVVGFVPPYALQRILSALQDPTPQAKTEAYFFAFVTFIAHLSFAQVDLFKGWHTRRCYERARGQLFCALHYKALKRRDISGKVAHEEDEASNADLGKVVNLMQGDAYAVALRFWQFSAFFAAPIRLTIALTFLYRVIGPSSLAGVTVVLVAYALNYPLAKYNISITRSSWKAKDRRMNGVNELFQNVRFLKFYGWENHWAGKVRDYRETELNWRVKENIVATAISFIWTWVPSATALFSFMFYTLVAGERLTVSKAFTALALFAQLQEPMTALPTQFFALLHAFVSMQRIEAFLAENEVPAWASALKSGDTSGSENVKVGFSYGTFEWYDASKATTSARHFCLGPLEVDFPLGRMSLITGATGSGKSALLAALLGEMYCIDGNVHLSKLNHQVAYCAQNPWLEHATIRENIIYGSRRGFDEARYDAVIQACALERDLAMFDAGDQTEIGEKGVTLSGGQRARIALGRALYSEAACLLLDDPLAAVDMHTAQHLVDHCFSGDLMRNRTVILVTHHVTLCLPVATFILELSQGRVLRQGSIEELQALGQLQRLIEAEDGVEGPDKGIEPVENVMNEADASGVEDVVWKRSETSNGKLVEAEARAVGRVSLSTYLTYVRAAGMPLWVLTLILMLLIRLISIGTDFFLAKWGKAYEQGTMTLVRTVTLLIQSSPLSYIPSPDVDVRPWLTIYFFISITSAFSVLAYISLGYYASLQASRSLFAAMLARLTRAPSRFFDVTPIGRILNRFTSDINTVDDALQQSARAALDGGLNFLASFLVIVYIIPTFGPFALFIAWLYVRLAPPYVQASRDLRRLESVSLSPAFAGFDELLRGLSHIRAFAMEQKYQDRFYLKVDTFQAFDHVYWLVSGWLRWRYDCLGSVVVYVTTLFALLSGIGDDYAAIVIVRAGVFAEASRQLVKVAAQLELDFNSVERIGEYLEVPQEAPSIIDEKRPPAYWPSSNGQLIVEDLVVRYAPDLRAVLNGLSFTVHSREKIGVVGRTGSGKSTLALSLLRIIEPSSGKVILDGIDITSIGLEDLRTRITIVSQDVSLFSGTIRSNIDPFEEHSDLECWDVLHRCHLTNREGETQSGRITSLDTAISPSGTFSAGERQLVALARAILRRTQVIIMDEATSQIDTLLDDQIQKTIRDELSEALIITIAHRLKTIIDYDRILVLGPGGQILEFDTPRKLFDKPGGVFRDMCKRSADWEDLKRIVSTTSPR